LGFVETEIEAGIKIGEQVWQIMKSQRNGVYQFLLSDLEKTVGKTGENESLVYRYDKEENCIIVRRAKILYTVEAEFTK